MLFLIGTEMDYKIEKLSAQFVFNNPNQTSACGCGESVQLKSVRRGALRSPAASSIRRLPDDVSEYERWEARYRDPDYAFGKEPNYFLEPCKALLPHAGKALAVTDGEGRNGIWLAEQGLEVHSLDFSPSASRKARALAKQRRVDPHRRTGRRARLALSGSGVRRRRGDLHAVQYA